MTKDLSGKFTIEDIKSFRKLLGELQFNATRAEVRETAGNADINLLNTVDCLCRASNMLCMVIEQHLEGNISTSNPKPYITSNLETSNGTFRHYLRHKKKEYIKYE